MSNPAPLDLERYRARRWTEELALRKEEDRQKNLFIRSLLPATLFTPISAVNQYRGNLQVGERYKNLDYLFCQACMNSAIAGALISYDYSCPLIVDANFRMKAAFCEAQPKMYPPEFYDDLPPLDDVSDDEEESPGPPCPLRAKL